ncbi:MAG: 2-hydroxyglutaryl-CoA dehydratase [Desulfovibrio sp.]|nr:2-hydroxyglutaryl-CoA dehydratase [Desulfovibrio sp.]
MEIDAPASNDAAQKAPAPTPPPAGEAAPASAARPWNLGLDIGSTTVKAVLLDADDRVIFSKYSRHFSDVRGCTAVLLREMAPLGEGRPCRAAISGSGGISLAGELGLPFIQEVLASSLAIGRKIPDADAVIELGGEDAKLIFLTGGAEQRMNETCAGGTGAFIDQMAAFIGTDAGGLDALALRHKTIYPIASRCGVFAKSDILPLLNEGCAREDIAASIMQAVVGQTIGGLARGRPIKGKVVFLGGPLFFLASLRERFTAQLAEMTEAVFPEDGHFFVALGAAWHARDMASPDFSFARALDLLEHGTPPEGCGRLPALFADEEERASFAARHADHSVPALPLEEAEGDAWLGFDCGSTTIKAALIDGEGRLLYSFYEANKGDPLSAALGVLAEIYRRKKPGLTIRAAAATGYGSALLTAALRLDVDEVETVAHFTAASFFEPKVSFILDIGGQDIKCMRVREGVIDRISLNEACSAGCGSFIENFAESLAMPLPDFVAAALNARSPVDLGTRCTVFMNSKVKQAQKEGVAVGDIAAGLSWAVVRNAIFKVMKISHTAELGDCVVAQGGAFRNDALLRALELELGVRVTRPGIAGIMGAFGAALIAKKRGPAVGAATALIGPEAVAAFSARTATTRCRRCANACLLTVTSFGDGRRFISGNRCERGAEHEPQRRPNLYAYKQQRVFEPYVPLAADKAPRGSIGIPRALNIFENYPLWFTLLTRLGFRVELSAPSSKEIFYRGHDTIPSQTVCYPAKLSHGHVRDLVDKGVRTIFFPCVQREQKGAGFGGAGYNCPVVIGYPELLARNMGILEEKGVTLIHSFLPLERELLGRRLREIPFFADIPADEMEAAVTAAFDEMDAYRRDIRAAGEAALKELAQSGEMGLILAGHPYHTDPEVHHGVAELVTSCGLAVLTEDSVAHLMPDPGPLRVVDQWAYHSRLYRAGALATAADNLAVLQLLSFGCGLDAVTADQLEEIVRRGGRLYAQIKVDEGANLGPARIRIRSLLAAMRDQKERREAAATVRKISDAGASRPTCRKAGPAASAHDDAPAFTHDMRHTHTLLVPQMSPMHFQFVPEIFGAEGYDAVLLPTVSRKAIELGLRHVNNDACYPAIVVIGQLLEAVLGGQYDTNKIALVISQTGGGCRATNYVGFLRKALHDAGLSHIPIASFSTSISSPGIPLTRRIFKRLIMTGHYGDALMRMVHRLRPYEREPGMVEALACEWAAKARGNIASGGVLRFQRNMLAMIREFDRLPITTEERRPRVGLVGEILLKYHPDANNNAARIIEEEGGEAVVTDLIDFLLYNFYDHVFNYRHLAGPRRDARVAMAGIAFLEFTRLFMRYGFRRSRRFSAPARFHDLRRRTRNLISLGHQTGEGWLLGAEMVRMLESGVSGILCMQPFGCLPNHIVGKGLIRELKRRYPKATITALDYDPGASEVNQINRIKLMMRAGLHEASGGAQSAGGA